MANSQIKSTETTVRATFEIDEDTQRLIALANTDLYYGPNIEPDDGKPWPGFDRACDAISKALRDLDVSEMWVDTDCDYASRTEPDWCEGCDNDECEGQDPSSWVHVERRDVLRILVGRELVQYVS